MDSPDHSLSGVSAAAKRVLRCALATGENRVELLLVELQEERERLLLAILLALGACAFGLLAGVALTIAVVVLLWNQWPVASMVCLAAFYSGAALFLYARLSKLKSDWRPLQATFDQLRKDRECLEETLR